MNLKLASLLAPCLLTGLAAAQNVIYETTFETDAGWTLWSNSRMIVAVDSALPPGVTTSPSPPNSLRFTDLGPAGIGGSVWAVGSASSPVIDLTGADSPQVTFWLFWDHESTCQWDELSFIVTSASNGQLLYTECLSESAADPSFRRWSQIQRDLDPAWGEVKLWFTYDAIDGWFPNGEWGFLVDEFRVLGSRCGTSTLCVPQDRADLQPGPTLTILGDATPLANDLRLEGAGFPAHTFAVGLIGSRTGILPAGRGIRCVQTGMSVRMPVAPTRANGTPVWSLDLTDPMVAPMVQVGLPLFIQTIYRDGSSFNFSEAIRVDVCD